MASKVSIVNLAMVSIGHDLIRALDDSTPLTTLLSEFFEDITKYCMADDWYFNRKRVYLNALTQVYRLEVDEEPSPAVFDVGAVVTGQTSSVTCTVVEALSDTIYLVTKPSGDFTDDETLTDDADTPNSAVYYTDSENLEMGQYQYGYLEPSDCLYIRRITSLTHDKSKYDHELDGKIILTNCGPDVGYFNYNKYLGADDVSDLDLIPARSQSWFFRLISARIAYVYSANITENLKIRPKAELDWRTAYLEAKEQNGLEVGNSDFDGDDLWSDSVENEMLNL